MEGQAWRFTIDLSFLLSLAMTLLLCHSPFTSQPFSTPPLSCVKWEGKGKRSLGMLRTLLPLGICMILICNVIECLGLPYSMQSKIHPCLRRACNSYNPWSCLFLDWNHSDTICTKINNFLMNSYFLACDCGPPKCWSSWFHNTNLSDIQFQN